MTLTMGILEDAEGRQIGFREALARIAPDAVVTFHDNAPDFIEWLRGVAGSVTLVSLDGDLFLCGSKPEPGTGLDVVEFLAATRASFPVIVHSANPTKGDAMMEALRAAARQVHRADPLEARWMETQWIPAVKSALRIGDAG